MSIYYYIRIYVKYQIFVGGGWNVRVSYNTQRALKTQKEFMACQNVVVNFYVLYIYIYVTIFFYNQKILSFTCSRYEYVQLDWGGVREREWWSFLQFSYTQYFTHTHFSSSTRFSLFILLNSSHYIFRTLSLPLSPSSRCCRRSRCYWSKIPFLFRIRWKPLT